MNSLIFITMVLAAIFSSTSAFVATIFEPATKLEQLRYLSKADNSDINISISSTSAALFNDRRNFLHSVLTSAAVSAPFLIINEPTSALAATDECDILCRQQRYDRYMDSIEVSGTEPPPAQPIPAVTNKITYVVQMIIDIGAKRDNLNAGYIRFGLYGDDAPASVKQMLFFLTKGITSMNQEALENQLDVDYIPVSMSNGSVQIISPGKGIVFGVPSQSKSFAENKGLRAAGPNFIPQNRPTPTLEEEKFPRPHSCAGLISIPAKGIGYDTISSDDLDKIYSSAFTVTDAPLPELDKPTSTKKSAQQKPPSHRVIGQIIDNESMQFLERLATLPVQKKLGKDGSGPPLLKVRVRDVDVQKVKY